MALLTSTSGSKTSQAEWFSTDIAPAQGGKLVIHLAITSAVTIAYTLNSGTSWVTLNSGSALVADAGHVFEIPISPSATFNMRKATSGDVTVTFCEVHRL